MLDLTSSQQRQVSTPGVFYARATFVTIRPTRYDHTTDTLTELPERCTGLRIGVLHARLTCHHLKRVPASEGQTFIVTISRPEIRARLPLCPKCAK